MTIKDLYEQENMRLFFPEEVENDIAYDVLYKYLNNEPSYVANNSYLQQLLCTYFSTNNKNKKILDKLLESYKLNYQATIYNSMFYLFGKKNQFGSNYIDPKSWPGIIDIEKNKNIYELITKIGVIKVHRASQVFYKTDSYSIFRKKLMGQCYARTYDFLKKNKDFKAVLSYMPNLLYGGYYHAYLERDEEVLDIACNAYYDCKKEADKILCGEIIKKISYDEIEDECSKLEKEIGPIKDNAKLNILSLYYDRMNSIK